MGDEGLDQFMAGAAEGLRAAEIRRVGFDKIRIEVVLTDEKAEPIAEPGLAVVRNAGGGMSVRRRRSGRSSRRARERAQFFHRAEADAISLAECAIHRASFGDPHLSPMDQRGNVGGGSIAVTDKALSTVFL